MDNAVIDRNPFAGLPDVGVMRTKDVFKALGIADSTGYLWLSQGRLPKTISIGPNTRAIPNSELKAWGARLVSAAA